MKKHFGIVAGALIVLLGASSAASADGSLISRPVYGASPWNINASTPAVVGSYIAMVLQESSTPCFNCVNGGEQGTFGEGDPLGYVNSSLTSLGILYVYYNVSFSGTCAITITLTQGTVTLASGSGNFSPTPAVDYALLKITRQSTWHGAATMTGKLVCGALTVKNSGKVYFQ